MTTWGACQPGSTVGRREQAPGHQALPDALRLTWVADPEPGGQTCLLPSSGVPGAKPLPHRAPDGENEARPHGNISSREPGALGKGWEPSDRCQGLCQAFPVPEFTSACLVVTWQGHAQGLLGADGLLRAMATAGTGVHPPVPPRDGADVQPCGPPLPPHTPPASFPLSSPWELATLGSEAPILSGALPARRQGSAEGHVSASLPSTCQTLQMGPRLSKSPPLPSFFPFIKA